MPKFLTPYGDSEGNNRRIPVQYTSDKPSRTRQEFKDDADINNIIKTFSKTGMANHLSQYQGQYGDFASIDYHEAMNIVLEANEMFQTVPAQIRKEFNNDPKTFLDFVTNEDNRDRMIAMGLIDAPPRTLLDDPEPPPAAPAAGD